MTHAPSHTPTPRLSVWAAAVWIAVSSVTGAQANPVEDALLAEIKADIAAVETARKTTKVTPAIKQTIRKHMARLAKNHNNVKSKSGRSTAQRALGNVLKTKSIGTDVRMRAADVLKGLNDPSGAFKQLKAVLPRVKDEAVGPVALAVIDAVGYVSPDAAIRPLNELMMRSPDPQAVEHAATALGYFSFSKRRVQVLESLIARLQRRPGAPKKGVKLPRGQDDAVAADRAASWQLAETAVVNALRRLTGQKNILTAEAWVEAARTNKKTRTKLFLVAK